MFALSLLLCVSPLIHDGPEPIIRWDFKERNIEADLLKAIRGPSIKIHDKATFVPEISGQSLLLDGDKSWLELGPASSYTWLPKKRLTVTALVSVEKSYRDGGIVGCLNNTDQDKSGWLLGYNDRTFSFKLNTSGQGRPTTLFAKTQFEWGKLYHVAATYDGEEMKIYVNGKQEGVSRLQKGEITYSPEVPFSIGGWRYGNTNYKHGGRLNNVTIYDITGNEKAIEHLYEHDEDLTKTPPKFTENPELKWLVEPYQQYPTENEITISWETSRMATSVVKFGPSEKQMAEVTGKDALIHHVRLKGLKRDSHYVFQVESTDSTGKKLTSELLTFRTALGKDQPVRFAVVGDTQDQPAINKQVAERMWETRPDFFMIVGDLVGTGPDKSHWLDHFFGSMRPLLSRVPLMPVLGNHERDARLYYDYMDIPQPKYYYSFKYGCGEFFVIDSQRDVSKESEQVKWLEQALAKSTASWKFVAHHYPPFSSDEDDYGDRWKGQSEWGDTKMREITQVYEKYGVDMVFTGHIHSYERTFPILKDTVRKKGGVTYVVCGGGGGHLERPAPTRPWFSNVVRYGHHFCQLSITNEILEMRSYDIEGKLFDTFTIDKSK